MKVDLPGNVLVRAVGGDPLATVGRIYREVLRALWLFLGEPVYQWKAHPYVSRAMRFYARVGDTRVLAAARNAFPLALPALRIAGQGMDTQAEASAREARWVSVGRISPVKRVHLILAAVARCNRRTGRRVGLDLYGPVPARDRAYRAWLDEVVRDHGLEGLVTFHGPVRQDALPPILNRYQGFLHFCDGALDKPVVEAMACGLPVLSTNHCLEEVVPADLRDALILPEGDVDAQAARMGAVLDWTETERAAAGQGLRRVAAEEGCA